MTTSVSELQAASGRLYPRSFAPKGRLWVYEDEDTAHHPMRAYVIRTIDLEPGLVKVGLAEDCGRRLATLQQSSPVRIEIADQFMVDRCAARWVERCAHSFLRDNHSHGEWFWLDDYRIASTAVRAARSWEPLFREFRINDVASTPEWKQGLTVVPAVTNHNMRFYGDWIQRQFEFVPA
jgi:hypothetical protein